MKRDALPAHSLVGADFNPLAACPHLAQAARLRLIGGPSGAHSANQSRDETAFNRYVREGEHPCVMARSVVNRKQVYLAKYGALGDPVASASVCHDLYEVLLRSHAQNTLFSLAALFPTQGFLNEHSFEAALWQQLEGMHEIDSAYFGWDPTVSRDPMHPNFSFSMGGVAWYVVGLHPHSSRQSRRFEVPTLIFNRHAQFERLRYEGRYEALRDRIRERDIALQGCVNPMLKDHGHASEALQYSGRAVDDGWVCPFVGPADCAFAPRRH